MPTVVTAPGVYIEEIPSGNRTISAASTSITAFVGRAPRGPVDVPVRCDSFGTFERRFGGLWAHSELGHAVAQFFAAGGGTAIVCRLGDGATAASGELDTAGGANPLVLRAVEPGQWGSALRATVSLGGPAGTATAVTNDSTFHLTLEEIDPVAEATSGEDRAVLRREVHPQVSVDPASTRHVDAVLAHGSRLAQVAMSSTSRPVAAARARFAPGLDGATTAVTTAAYERALAGLDTAEDVNLMCLPPLDRRTPPPSEAWDQALSWVERRRAVLLVDPPAEWTDAKSVLAGMPRFGDGLRSPQSAFYYPRVLAPDPLQEGRLRPFAPCGAVAGVLARTDATRGIWKAPAGTEAALDGVGDLEVDVREADSGLLTPRGINTLRRLPGAGVVVWGARTGHGADVRASEWKYLPVRRLALHIENSVAASTRWAVFEPNGEGLWSQLRLAIGGFMNGLFRQGAFAGTSAREAYLVRCDATTTTTADIATGIVNVLVGFAPIKPAEFVMLRFQQIVGQDAA